MYEAEVMEFYSKVPVFSLSDLVQIIPNRVYAKKFISRMIKKGKVKRIRKGLYTFHDDPFLIATFLLKPSYISTVSALSYYHKITQIPNEVFCFTSKPTKTYFFIERINFCKTKYFFGFEMKKYAGVEIPIATVEKAIIDSIGTVPLSVIDDSFEEVDVKRMISYLKVIMKSSIIKRVGFLLEENGYNVYQTLKKYMNNKYIPLDPIAKSKGKRNSKWKLVI